MAKTFFDEAKEAVAMFMAMAVTTRLRNDGLLEKPNKAPNEEQKLAAVKEGVAAIKDEMNKAFKPDEEAQRMKAVVQEDLIRHHFSYFGYEYEEHEAGE